MPGFHAGPFEWSMSAPAWQLFSLIPLVYLGAFLSGLRPSRWFGTRLLPLATSLALLTLISQLAGWMLGLSLSLALGGFLVANIRFVAQVRDYA
jgi:hypothetical protein